MVTAKNLRKSYDTFEAVRGIDLQIYKGECFGLLGPNGAGKSTTMKMMYGSSLPTNGELFILDENVRTSSEQIKRQVGVVPQDDGLDVEFSVLENLLIYASYFDIPEQVAYERAQKFLQDMKLWEYASRSVETLSGGMKRRLTIARGLMNDPELLFLDEPTTGLDPQARQAIWEYFGNLKAQKKTIVLTTHYMEEAEALCDRLAIIDQGQILALDTPLNLITKNVGREVMDVTLPADRISYYQNRLRAENFQFQNYFSSIQVFIESPEQTNKCLEIFAREHFHLRRASLNDVFLKIAGHQLRADS
ncbi:MAG: ABC transporter ATP-binding protein [Bdellovibrionota bacterium]